MNWRRGSHPADANARPTDAELHRLATYLEAHAESQVKRVIGATAILIALGLLVLCLFLGHTMARVTENSVVIDDLQMLTEQNRRWIQLLKADEDMQKRRADLVMNELHFIRGRLSPPGGKENPHAVAR